MAKGDKTTHVGRYFEALGHQILGGELSRNENGDICLWSLDTTVEVKSSGFQSSYGFRLDVNQIERDRRLFGNAWYMMFAYHNPTSRGGDGLKHSALSRHSEPEGIQQFLADSALWCVVVDISIVKMWQKTIPHSTKSIMGHLGTKTVDIKCRDLVSFVNSKMTDELTRLGLEPEKFSKLYGHLNPENLTGPRPKGGIPFLAILPKARALSLQRSLRRRGLRLQRRAV